MKLKKTIAALGLGTMAFSGLSFGEARLPGTKLDTFCGNVQAEGQQAGEHVSVCLGRVTGYDTDYISLRVMSPNIRSTPVYFDVVRTESLEDATKYYAITDQDELVIVKIDNKESEGGYYPGVVKLAGNYYGAGDKEVEFNVIYHTQTVIPF